MTILDEVTVPRFTRLPDTPASYTGEGLKYVRVNAAETGLEFAATTILTNTLDEAYDEGGAGAGRQITVDSGAVQLTNAGRVAALATDQGAGDQAVLFTDGDFVVGGAVMSGTEKFRCIGSALIEGKITGNTIALTVAVGTPPLAIVSTTLVTNLNADLLDGIEGAAIVLRDGTTALTANWDVGNFKIVAQTLTADIATGTSPLGINSTTLVSNLNADLLDGLHAGSFAPIAHTHRLDQITNPNVDKMFTMTTRQLKFRWTAPVTAAGALELEVTGAFTGDVLHIHQHTGNPGPGTDLVHLEAADADVCPMRIISAAAVALTVNQQIESTLAIGTAPFVVTSTTVVTNLNADSVDGVNIIGGMAAEGILFGISATSMGQVAANLSWANGTKKLSLNGTGEIINIIDGTAAQSAATVNQVKTLTYGRFTEQISADQAPGADATWTSVDVSGTGAVDGDILECLLENTEFNAPNFAGVRTDGSVIDRRVQLNEAEGGGSTTAIMLVLAAGTPAKIEIYETDDSEQTTKIIGRLRRPA